MHPLRMLFELTDRYSKDSIVWNRDDMMMADEPADDDNDDDMTAEDNDDEDDEGTNEYDEINEILEYEELSEE